MKRFRSLKKLLTITVGLLACWSYGQSNFYKTLKLDATFVVKKHTMGAELVELTVLGNDFSQATMANKLEALGKELKVEPWGLQMSSWEGKFVKASFATRGLITADVPKFNLAALTRAFAFGDHPIRSFSVFFEGFKPDQATPGYWLQNTWKFDSVYTSNPLGIEYRVKVDTNNPADIFIGANPTPKAAPKAEPDRKSTLFIFGGIIIGAIAIGLLVYSALLRPRRA